MWTRKGKVLHTTASALHSNKPSPRQKPTTINKQKSQTKSRTTPSYCGQGLQSATGIQGKQRSFAHCTLNTGYGGLKSKNYFIDHIAGNILALTDTSSLIIVSQCAVLSERWKRMADYLTDVIFLVNALGLFSNHLKNISWYRYRTLQKENVKGAMVCSW